MFQKIHLKMTFFCTLATGLILLSMTLSCLLLFESLLKKNDTAVFEKNKSSILAYLEGAEVIDYGQLSKIADNHFYTIALFGNGTLLSLPYTSHSEEAKELVDLACQKALAAYNFDAYNPPKSRTIIKQLDFKIKYQKAERLVSFASLPNKYGSLCILILYSRLQLTQQIFSLRIAFLFIDVAALLLLFLFSWKFSDRILIPVEKNRKKQVQFVAAASHELRSPLSVILSAVTALKVADDEDRPVFYQSIESEGKRMRRLIDDMLSLANADNGSWSMFPEPVQMDTLLLNTYEKYLPLSRTRKLQFTIRLPESLLPECLCDRQRMEQVLGILLDNAFTYTQSGGEIGIELSLEQNRIKIGIFDTGQGITKEDKEHIFERFYRADASRKGKQHFGLGLSIAKEIVELNGGKIWVEDHSPQGTVFYITLPHIESYKKL